MTAPQAPLFQSRHGYRGRRLADAARFLPALGLALFMAPLLGRLGHATSGSVVYLFGVWAALVLAAVVLSGPLSRRLGGDTPPDGPVPGGTLTTASPHGPG